MNAGLIGGVTKTLAEWGGGWTGHSLEGVGQGFADGGEDPRQTFTGLLK